MGNTSSYPSTDIYINYQPKSFEQKNQYSSRKSRSYQQHRFTRKDDFRSQNIKSSTKVQQKQKACNRTSLNTKNGWAIKRKEGWKHSVKRSKSLTYNFHRASVDIATRELNETLNVFNIESSNKYKSRSLASNKQQFDAFSTSKNIFSNNSHFSSNPIYQRPPLAPASLHRDGPINVKIRRRNSSSHLVRRSSSIKSIKSVKGQRLGASATLRRNKSSIILPLPSVSRDKKYNSLGTTKIVRTISNSGYFGGKTKDHAVVSLKKQQSQVDLNIFSQHRDEIFQSYKKEKIKTLIRSGSMKSTTENSENNKIKQSNEQSGAYPLSKLMVLKNKVEKSEILDRSGSLKNRENLRGKRSVTRTDSCAIKEIFVSCYHITTCFDLEKNSFVGLHCSEANEAKQNKT